MKSNVKMLLHRDLLAGILAQAEGFAFDLLCVSNSAGDQAMAYMLLDWCQAHREAIVASRVAGADGMVCMVKVKVSGMAQAIAVRNFLSRCDFSDAYLMARATDWMNELDAMIDNHPMQRLMAAPPRPAAAIDAGMMDFPTIQIPIKHS